jgi:hypothetical protein
MAPNLNRPICLSVIDFVPSLSSCFSRYLTAFIFPDNREISSEKPKISSENVEALGNSRVF